MADGAEAQEPRQRPKLNLKPRDPNEVAKIEAERANSAKLSPFGAAKPREQVLAASLGKSEQDILAEEVKREKLHLRLEGAHLDEKRTIESELKELQAQLKSEEDDTKKEEIQAQVDACQAKLDDIVEKFAKATLDSALSGDAPRMSQIRRQQQQQQQQMGVHPGGGRYNPSEYQAYGGGGPQRGGRGGGRGRGGYGGGGYNDYGGRGLPEWARDGPPHSHGGGGYNKPYVPSDPNDEYGGDSDAGFFDAPGFSGGSGGYVPRGGGGRGGPRGGGARGGGGRGGGYNKPSYGSGGHSALYTGGGNQLRGVGGEIELDDGWSDRY